jgi:hypothetical protein
MSKGIPTFVLIVGIIMVCVGCLIPVPGEHLTTWSILADEENSVIEEYVGGDAYNYIIGANIVGSKICACTVVKGVFVALGVTLFCFGLLEINKANNMNLLLEKSNQNSNGIQEN